ncbi:alpha/beta-hydrolase [Zopfia rhizophila CBS 207.26]|uniref:Alpha/beta-hydrolase n=1 Tax=Zopfia rhizophila CBS 207.26 TaxID=1314779 RepID=A0A6A6DIG4_9PEZI|nr:alpha/beta-hydrolase [Zopfia rhizophila CBS 207.26]
MSRHAFSVLFSLGSLSLAAATPLFPRQNNVTNTTTVQTFAEVPVSANLTWTPCFDDFTCANLEVPLDYADLSAGTTVVAFIKKDARTQPAKDILFNPGGPGGSGISFMIAASSQLNQILGSQYNLVSFDPRGVNNSGPNLDCFEGKPALRDFYDTQTFQSVDANSTTSLSEQFSKADGFGKWCTRTLNDTAGYANTPAVATDMLHFAELRKEAEGKPADEAKLYYYGVSYGTILGSTFASLYPDRVGRLILDGVADAEDYYAGLWKSNLHQTDDAINSFFEFCYNAGSDCIFHQSASSPADIERRFNAVLESLSETPLSVSDPEIVDYPVIVTAGDVRGWILWAMYGAIERFPILARIMAELEVGNATTYITLSQEGKAPESECNFDAPLYSSNQPKLLISCNDANGRYNMSTVEAWKKHVDELVDLSFYIGEVWAPSNSVNCRSLEVKPPKSQVFNGFKNGTKTSFPILFVENKFDPVTPSAKKMSSFFPGSVVLTQNAVGHGLSAAESNCIIGYVQQYLGNGTLPKENTVCEVKDVPFLASEERRAFLAKRSVKL